MWTVPKNGVAPVTAIQEVAPPKRKRSGLVAPDAVRRSDVVFELPSWEGLWDEHQRLVRAVLALSDLHRHPVTRHEYRALLRRAKMLRADIARHRQDAANLRRSA